MNDEKLRDFEERLRALEKVQYHMGFQVEECEGRIAKAAEHCTKCSSGFGQKLHEAQVRLEVLKEKSSRDSRLYGMLAGALTTVGILLLVWARALIK